MYRLRPIGWVGTALVAATGLVWVAGDTPAAQGDDISGVVRSGNGPEAGVWVIAATDDLETVYRKIVVTDDDGRFLVPDLPDASYRVWARGYGPVDSAKVQATPGAEIELTPATAATPQGAAAIYPATYWYSLVEAPLERDFPGTGEMATGAAVALTSQVQIRPHPLAN